MAGWTVYHIPQDLPSGVTADDALWTIPKQPEPVPGIWIGYIPLPQHYEEIYQAALRLNIRLLNNPDEFRRAEEFDKFYPLIADLTAKTECVESLEQCEAAALHIGYPVFLKGAVQSLKAKGIDACVAHDAEDLRRIATALLGSHRRSLGKIIIRKWIPLRHSRIGPGGFPFGREYRVFLYREEVLGMGYYWEGEDELASLSPSERQGVGTLATAVSTRLKVPYVAVDIGQTEQGDWIAIEVGDAQFSGLSQTPIHQLWTKIAEAVRSKIAASQVEVESHSTTR